MSLAYVTVTMVMMQVHMIRSTGCTVHEMVTTHPPWGDLPPEAAMFRIGVGQTIPNLPDHVSSSLREFYHLCLIR